MKPRYMPSNRLAAAETCQERGWTAGTRLASASWQVDRVITQVLGWGVCYDHVRLTRGEERLHQGNVMRGFPKDVKRVGGWGP